MKNIEWKDVLKIQDDNNIIVDIRPKEIFEEDKVNDKVINLNHEMLENNEINFDKTKKYYIYCNRGIKSKEITEMLLEKGFDATNINGGVNKLKNK